MLVWVLRVNRICRDIRATAAQALLAHQEGDEGALLAAKSPLCRLVDALRAELPGDFPASRVGDLRRHAVFGHGGDLDDILVHDLPDVESKIEDYARRGVPPLPNVGFEGLLHPRIAKLALGHYRNGDFRNAVLDAITGVFDEIRKKTGLDADGEALVTRAFSADNPLLVFSELDMESGRNDQVGFMTLFRGAYKGIRNPKAHSLQHDLDEVKAGQYLVFASLLMRRVMEAKKPN